MNPEYESTGNNNNVYNKSEGTEKKNNDTNRERPIVGWGGQCPDYLYEDIREYYEVDDDYKISNLFLLSEVKRDEFIKARDNVRDAANKYNVTIWDHEKNNRMINRASNADALVVEEFQTATYQSLDLYNVLNHPLRTLIQHVYNEMESIYEKDVEDFKEEQRLKKQMYEFN